MYCLKKHQIRLSDYYIDDIPNLSAIGIYKLILSIQSFKEKCKLFECDKIIVVATETLRKCANKDVILNEIKRKLDLKLESCLDMRNLILDMYLL